MGPAGFAGGVGSRTRAARLAGGRSTARGAPPLAEGGAERLARLRRELLGAQPASQSQRLAHLIEIALAAGALRQVGLEPPPRRRSERSFQISRDQLDQLFAAHPPP